MFTSERSAIKAIKEERIQAGDVLVLMGRGPAGTGMEETYQLTSALKHLPWGKHVAVLTDALGLKVVGGGDVLKEMAAEYEDDHPEEFIAMCRDMLRAAVDIGGSPVRFYSNF